MSVKSKSKPTSRSRKAKPAGSIMSKAAQRKIATKTLREQAAREKSAARSRIAREKAAEKERKNRERAAAKATKDAAKAEKARVAREKAAARERVAREKAAEKERKNRERAAAKAAKDKARLEKVAARERAAKQRVAEKERKDQERAASKAAKDKARLENAAAKKRTSRERAHSGPTQGLTVESIAQQIRQAYLNATNGAVKERVLLKDLRPRVGVQREDFDQALLSMQRQSRVVLMGLDNPMERTPEVEAAALHIAGHPRHLVYFQG
jgi:hypothetical protein